MAIESGRPFPAEDPSCELCEAARFTHWYVENEYGWVADCEVCGVPMVVWWHHGTEPPEKARNELLRCLSQVADDKFGEGNWKLDRVMRQVPEHFHAHARDSGWFAARGRRISRYNGVGGSAR